MEELETRTLLSSVTPNPITVNPLGSPGPVGLTPAQIIQAYHFNLITFMGAIHGDGTGQTIAIVDAYDNPNLLNSSDPNFNNSDLHKFDVQFNLADPTFTKVGQDGGAPPAATDPTGGWELEEDLDVEWAHALAPRASIVLVEANTNSLSDLINHAVNFARGQTGVSVVSLSWGTNEFTGETSYDSYFTTPANHSGVTFVAASGDNGATPTPPQYPAVSPNVLAVGGTTLTLDANNNWQSETGWSKSGGGISTVEAQPNYQNGVVTQSTTQRTNPDVAFDADPNSGVAVYSIFYNNVTHGNGPWFQVGGTSFGAPAWSALIAIADQGRAQVGYGSLDGRSQTLPKLYAMPYAASFHDITTGNNGYAAGPGYDLVTGLGTPLADQVARNLAGVTWVDVHTGDFNGDGKSDIVGRVKETGQWWVGISNGSSSFTTSLWGTWSTSVTWVNVMVGDFNGDGKADIAGRNSQTGDWYVSVSNGSSFTTSIWTTWSTSVTWVDVNPGDFSGDGKTDIIARNLQTGQWNVGTSTGSSFTNSIWSTWSTAVTWVDVKVGVFNGGNAAGIAGRVSNNSPSSQGQWWVAYSTGSSFNTYYGTTWSTAVTWVDVNAGDFTGDHQTDIVGRALESGQWWVAVSTVPGFTNYLFTTWSTGVTWVDLRVGDFNGDGLSDIAGMVSNTSPSNQGQWWVGLASAPMGGPPSFNNALWTTWASNVNWVDVNVGDFNGDHKSDLVGRNSQTGQWYVAISNGSSFAANALWDTWNPPTITGNGIPA